MQSSFTQLAGRISCVGSENEGSPNCIAIIARVSKKKQKTEEDFGRFTWIDCLKLFDAIPFKINEKIVFCSYDAKTSMKEDDVTLSSPENKKIYYYRIEEVSSDRSFDKIFNHLEMPPIKKHESISKKH